ncbi:uncharacterized protein BDCG_03547 [Blastomyces dermatitidis ER-3]|uniref:Uncharacterized protein n=1 Tax=Ajellomyces dermatitidis (strain ER-3 / ATCC MYA-2586) TaxID=559297 RepID=A0ABP2EZU8_AJEDR|nr:uncharacterized protein BDCG_03547 [Blastomyces dermatitidis ER-3]EEQ88427.1 hypothetical protein BDCG_03547 [Blastomyces dermatitidis ER-3]
MESLNSVIAGEPKAVNANDEATHALSQVNLDESSKAHQNSTNVANGVNNITQADERSEICVSPSWKTDKERKERKKELKRIAKEKKELERSSKHEAKKPERSSFNEPRRLTKKPPSKTPSRASSIRSILPRSSTAPSILGFWSNSTSKDDSARDETVPATSPPDVGADKTANDPPESTKLLFTGHLPQRFGGKITPDPEYYKTSSRATGSNSPSPMPSSPSNKPRRHLHMAKKHSDLRAAAKAFRSSDPSPQNTNTPPTRSSWSQELTRRLSNSNGKKLQRRSLKAEHEPHMYSLRRASTNKENENRKPSGRKTEKSVPSTPTSSHFHSTTGISPPSPRNSSRITVVQPEEKIPPPHNTTGQLHHEAPTLQNSVNGTSGSSEPQEQPPAISVIPPLRSPQKTTHTPPVSQRKHGRRHSWSEILTNSDRVAGLSLKRRGPGHEPPQTSVNGDIDEFKTSGPYEYNYGSNGVFKSHAAHSDPSLTPASWHVAPEDIGIAGDFPQVQSGSSSPNTTPTSLPADPIDTLKTPTIIDPDNMELVATAPTVKQRENSMRTSPKVINRDVPFKSSPLAGPPLNNQDDENALESAQIATQEDADTSSKAKNGKSGFSFSRILRHERKKEKSSTSFGRRYSLKNKLTTATGKSKQQPKALVSGSNELQRKQDTDKKTASKLPYPGGLRSQATSRPPSASSRQFSLIAIASNEMSSDIKIPPKSPKRNSGVFPTPASTRPSSASGVETMSISSNGTETPKKKRSISVDISKIQVLHEPWKERFTHKSTPGHASPTLSSSQTTPIISTFPSAKQPATDALASSDLPLRTPERHHQTHPGPIFDPRPDSSNRRSLANHVGNGRVASQRPARRGTPVAKMFVICCQCRYWHDMPSDVYAKLAFPNGPPHLEPLIADDSHSPPHQAQHPTARSGFAAHGGGSSSTFTETSSGASNNALDNKSPRGSRPSSSSSSSSNNFTVTCCWCAHRMVKTCCAGWTTIVYLHERHH